MTDKPCSPEMAEAVAIACSATGYYVGKVCSSDDVPAMDAAQVKSVEARNTLLAAIASLEARLAALTAACRPVVEAAERMTEAPWTWTPFRNGEPGGTFNAARGVLGDIEAEATAYTADECEANGAGIVTIRNQASLIEAALKDPTP